MIFGDNFADNQARVADIRAAAGQCSAELPFLLLPVRLEARFVEFTEAAPVPTLGQPSPVPTPERLPARPQLPRTRTIHQLRVRVFPDDISILTHEPDLTIPERDAGIAHWREVAAGARTSGRSERVARPVRPVRPQPGGLGRPADPALGPDRRGP
jgi:hypothetical protein